MKHIFSICVVSLLLSATGMAKEPQQPQSYNYQRGVELIRSGKTEEGIEYLHKELNQDIKNGYAYAWMASAYLTIQEKGTALSVANKALKYLPKADKHYIAWTNSMIGDIYLQLQDTTQALNFYTRAVKTEPRNEEWYEYRGHLYRDLKLWDKSDADFRQYIKLTPGLVRGINMLARNLYLQERYDEALEQYRYSNRLAERPFTYVAMAQIEILLNRYEEAAEDLIACLQMEPGEGASMELIRDSKNMEFLELIQTKLQARILANPNEQTWYLCMMYAYQAMHRYEDAIRTCLKIQTMNPDSYFDDYMADLFYAMGDWQNALRYQSRAVESDSTNIGFRYSRAFTYCEMDSTTQMFADMDYLIESHPDDAQLYFVRAGFRSSHGDCTKAVEDYNIGLAFNADRDWERYQRGRCYEILGNTDKASKDYQYVLSHPSAPETRMFVLLSTGHKQEALLIADSLLNAAPAQYRYNAACVYALAGEKAKALTLLEEEMKNGYVRFSSLRHDPDLQAVQGEELEALIDKYQAQQQSRIAAFNEEMKEKEEAKKTEKQTGVVEIPFITANGVTRVECTINGLPLNFIFDTGASDVTISQTEANFMFKNGYLSQRDIVGTQKYRTADGHISTGTIIMLNHINFGGLELTGVRASVVGNQKAPLLLGQTILQRLGKIEIDNERRVLRIIPDSVE